MSSTTTNLTAVTISTTSRLHPPAHRDGAMRQRPAGVTLIYAILIMTVLSAMASLAVDFGRVQMAKTELRRAADAAARAGAAGIVTDPSEAIRLAKLYASENKVDGQPLPLDAASDIEFYKWDLKSGTGQKLTGVNLSQANAIRVIARRSASTGNGIPMMFASLLGFDSCTVTAESTAMVIPPIDVDQNIAATANPFLSGMPAGSVASQNNPHNSPDYAGNSRNLKQSPTVVSMPLAAGATLTFDSIDGTARHDPNLSMYQPDGQLDDIGHNNPTPSQNNAYGTRMYDENGIADMISPINALVGVFLDDNQPSATSAPSENLNFSTAADRNFTKLEPQLKQLFFIGDGKTDDGRPQQFIVPKGATRLFLATWDFYEWNNNAGTREVIVSRPMQIITVK